MAMAPTRRHVRGPMVLPSWLSRQEMPVPPASVGRRLVPSGRAWESISGWTRMERARTGRIVSAMVGRDRLAILVKSLAFVIGVSACAVGDTPPPAGIRPDGFPTGVFEKTYDDRELGPLRLSWVFAANGDWAEVPETTAGQTTDTGPARGHYTSTAIYFRSRSTHHPPGAIPSTAGSSRAIAL